jgi:U3 small nucleolar RNA-associated protein 6
MTNLLDGLYATNDPLKMTNLDGIYATNDVEQGTIILKETNMPDCELHRSATNPNCEVVELEDGTSAVVSSRAIAAGEFLCVSESSDEEDGMDFEEDEGSFEEEEEEECRWTTC